MTEELIEARVLQEITRGLFDLLQRIHEIPPEEPLPLDEVAAFTQQVGMIVADGLVARPPIIFKARQDCHLVRQIFKSRQDCHIVWNDKWYLKGDMKPETGPE